MFRQVRVAVYQETETRQLSWESSSLFEPFFFNPVDDSSENANKDPRENPTVGSAQPERTQKEPIFRCDLHQGLPAIVGKHPSRGDVTFIVFQSNYFLRAGYSPQERCQIISQKFEQNRKNGHFQYIVSGVFNNYPVLCGSREVYSEVINCPDARVLMTLKGEDDSQVMIEKIMEQSQIPTNNNIIYHNSVLKKNEDSDLYAIDVDMFWDRAPRTTASRAADSQTQSEITPPQSGSSSSCAWIGECN